MFLSFSIVLALVGLDQYSKAWVEARQDQVFDMIPGFIELRYSQNTGIAFSLLEDYPEALTIINTLIVLILVIYLLRSKSYSLMQHLPYLFIIAGGIGNLIDRYTKSYVVDFINPTFIDFAIFNLADCFLNIGVMLLILEVLFNARRKV